MAAIVNAEKEKASKAYFEALISKAESAPSSHAPATGMPSNEKLSPIEEIFHNHMKRSLAAYQEYYQVEITNF